MPHTRDDSWDLASSVGATATMVATSRALASRQPDLLLDDPFDEPLVRAVARLVIQHRVVLQAQISERWRRFGFDLSAADLFYLGERSIVVDYLTNHGWQVDEHPTKKLYARNGFQFLEDSLFGEMSYVAATLT